MDALIAYRICHFVGISLLSVGVGGMMVGGERRKTFVMLQGIGLVVMLVTGFGMLARLGLGFPHFAMVKVGLWLLLGISPMLFRKLRTPPLAEVLILLLLVGVLAYLGLVKPALW